MAPTTTPAEPRREDREELDAVVVAKRGWRERMGTHPATRHPYRITVFVVGLLCIAGGLALAVLPGPLTIPPVLLGLWIWSWEFAFAQRFFDAFKRRAEEAWEQARARPFLSALVTVGGLLAAGVALWAVAHYDLVARAKDAVGL